MFIALKDIVCRWFRKIITMKITATYGKRLGNGEDANTCKGNENISKDIERPITKSLYVIEAFHK